LAKKRAFLGGWALRHIKCQTSICTNFSIFYTLILATSSSFFSFSVLWLSISCGFKMLDLHSTPFIDMILFYIIWCPFQIHKDSYFHYKVHVFNTSDAKEKSSDHLYLVQCLGMFSSSTNDSTK
jgi:hypothetical protein